MLAVLRVQCDFRRGILALLAAMLALNGMALRAADPQKYEPQEIAERIDRCIQSALRDARVDPAEIADDAEFLRRVSLDITGTIPSRQRVRAFLADHAAAKRAKLIDELLASPNYGKHFGNLWRDRLAHEDLAGPYRRRALAEWLAEQFNQGRGWGEIVTQLITAEQEHAASAFIFDNLDDGQPRPNKLVANSTKLFLGCQLQCAECHDHPTADWKQKDFWGLAAFFARTAISEGHKGGPAKGVFERSAGTPPTRFGPAPIKVSADGAVTIPSEAGARQGTAVPAQLLGSEPQQFPAEGAVRPLFATWLTAPENPYFSRAGVNRLWAHFFGRGIVNPVDDIHVANGGSHPDVLTLLAEEFARSGFDQKHLVRCICLSKAYQRTSRQPVKPTHSAEKSQAEPRDLALFGRMRLKVLNTEMLYAALLQSTDAVGRDYKGLMRGFQREFATRDENTDPTEFTNGIPQILAMMNEARFFNGEIPLTSHLKNEWSKRQKSQPDNPQAQPEINVEIEEVFLAVVGRLPLEAEMAPAREYVLGRKEPGQGFKGLWWALINGPEFAVIR